MFQSSKSLYLWIGWELCVQTSIALWGHMTSVNPAETTGINGAKNHLAQPGDTRRAWAPRCCSVNLPPFQTCHDVCYQLRDISSHFGKVQKGVYTQQVQVDQPLPVGRIGKSFTCCLVFTHYIYTIVYIYTAYTSLKYNDYRYTKIMQSHDIWLSDLSLSTH